MSDNRQQFELRFYACCLMTNHVHLLVQFRAPRELSPMMAGLQRAYVHPYHRRTRPLIEPVRHAEAVQRCNAGVVVGQPRQALGRH
jgi:REP element-mobilizing transposase RayT